MKKALLAVLSAASFLFAESYQVNTLSARQLGMAHTGAGLKLGAEAMHFNPGALGFLDKTLDFSAGATFIIPEVEFHGSKGLTKNTTMGTPLYIFAASNITPWLSAGVSFTTPYGNSADYGKNWEGAGLLQDISLAVYAVQPTVAFKPIDQISFGGGPVINFGSFSQSKAVVPAGALEGYRALAAGISALNPQGSAAITQVLDKYKTNGISATFEGDADVAVGFHLGALYEIIQDKLSLGVSYRSKTEVKVAKGKVNMKGAEDFRTDMATLNTIIDQVNPVLTSMGASAAPNAPALPELEKDNFEATLPLPSNLNAGLSFSPMDKLLLAFDFQWIGWGAYDKLVLTFKDTYVGVENGAPTKSQTSLKKYSDTFAYRLGAQYTVIDMLDVRLGMYFDETPVEDEFLTPESPSTNKLGSTIGFSFRPIPNLSIDAAFLYALGFGRDAKSGSNPKKAGDGIDGRYEVQAWVPSVGIRFAF